MANQTVAVTGATGFVGRSIVGELLRRGVRVRALARSRAKARGVLGAPGDALTVIEGDIHDVASVRELLTGAQACVNLVGIIREQRGGVTFHRVHVAATRVLVETCREVGVTRYVQMSALGVSDDGNCPYRATKWEAEEIVRRSGLDWTIFRPGLIHGKDSSFVEMAREWVKGEAPPFFFLPYFRRGREDFNTPLGGVNYSEPMVQPVLVDDVAAAFAAALEKRETIGETYNLVGAERLSWPAMLRVLRDQIPGANPRIEPWGVPGDLAAAGAWALGQVGLSSILPFDYGMAVMGAEDSVSETEKARKHLGLSPRGFRESLATYAAGL